MEFTVDNEIYVINDYPLRVGKNCMLSSVRDILKFNNINMSESDIYFICKGFRFQIYWKNKIHSISDFFRYDLYGHISTNLSCFFRCKVTVRKILSCAEIKSLLYNRIPVIYIMDPRIVPYNNRTLNPTGQQEMHSAVLYGFNEKESCYLVADSTIADDTGYIFCDKTLIDQTFLHNNVKGFLYLTSVNNIFIEKRRMQVALYETIKAFLFPHRNKSICEGVDAINYVIEMLKTRKIILEELQFLIQAYFMPFFYYIDECLKYFKHIPESRTIIKKEKNKWDIFYYKHLMRYSDKSNEGKLIERFQYLFQCLGLVLLELLNDWYKQINNIKD